MKVWKIADPVSAGQIIALLESGMEIGGALTVSVESDDPDVIEAIQKSAAEAGVVLVLVEEGS